MKTKTRTKPKRNVNRGLLRQQAIKYAPMEGQREDFDVIPVLPLRTSEDLLNYVAHLEEWAGIGSAIAELGKDAGQLPAVILWDIVKALRVVREALDTATVVELHHDPTQHRVALISVVRESLRRNNVTADEGLSCVPAADVLGVVLDSLAVPA